MSVYKTICLLWVCVGHSVSLWSDLEMVSVTGLNGTESRPMHFDVRLKREKRGVYKIYCNLTVTAPMKDYTGKAIMFYSASNNNQYLLSPIRVPNGPLCLKVNNEYRRFLMNQTRGMSDLPVTDDPKADLCAMFEMKSYQITDFLFDTNKMPKFLKPGMYKVLILFSQKNIFTGGAEGIYRLS